MRAKIKSEEIFSKLVARLWAKAGLAIFTKSLPTSILELKSHVNRRSHKLQPKHPLKLESFANEEAEESESSGSA